MEQKERTRMERGLVRLLLVVVLLLCSHGILSDSLVCTGAFDFDSTALCIYLPSPWLV
jgi:hypothetical protein